MPLRRPSPPHPPHPKVRAENAARAGPAHVYSATTDSDPNHTTAVHSFDRSVYGHASLVTSPPTDIHCCPSVFSLLLLSPTSLSVSLSLALLPPRAFLIRLVLALYLLNTAAHDPPLLLLLAAIHPTELLCAPSCLPFAVALLWTPSHLSNSSPPLKTFVGLPRTHSLGEVK